MSIEEEGQMSMEKEGGMSIEEEGQMSMEKEEQMSIEEEGQMSMEKERGMTVPMFQELVLVKNSIVKQDFCILTFSTCLDSICSPVRFDWKFLC